MLKTILRAIGYTLSYPFRSRVDSIDIVTLPPEVTPEDVEYAVRLTSGLLDSPTATDDYRDPPPPWVREKKGDVQ